jgi:peptidoglycan hydrolase-like protein with peptidoglycan-binding domain
MLAGNDPRIGSWTSPTGPLPVISGYSTAPSLDAITDGDASLRRGHGGSSVAYLQNLLNRLGASPPLAVDGAFGPLTEAAVQRYLNGVGQSGSAIDGSTLAAMTAAGLDGPNPPLRDAPRVAPRYGAAAAPGSVSAGSLQQRDEAQRNIRRSTPNANANANADANANDGPVQADEVHAAESGIGTGTRTGTGAEVGTGTRTGAVGDLGLPARDANAETGSAFIERTRGMSRADREQAILTEIQNGNIPDHLRSFKEVPVESTEKDGTKHTGTIKVLPDYLAIGSNEDHVQVPMTPAIAQAIADKTGTSLPTKKIVDTVHQNAEVKLRPQPLPAGPQMMSNAYYSQHDQLVDQQKAERGVVPGQLVSGNQKDLVISNRLTDHPDRVAIYGWHQSNGKPIQGLSTVHEASYADYSHGVRLVSGTMTVDGVEMPVSEVLKNPRLAGLISDEGTLRDPRVPS